jgi:hypothetical protein
MNNTGNTIPTFSAESLEAFISSNQHAFMPGEVFGAENTVDQQMLSFQVNEKDQTFAIFYPRAIPDKPASREARRPRYKMQPYIRIMQPGETSLVLDRPVKQEDTERFPQQWQRFLARQQNSVEGTPLEAMFPFHPEIVANCKASNILTVEALAGLSDAAMAAFGFGSGEMRERARRYLTAVSNPHGADLALKDEEAEKLKGQLFAAQQQLAGERARVDRLEAEIAAMKTGASVGRLGTLPAAAGVPGGYTLHSAPLGDEITEEEWSDGAGELVIRDEIPPAPNAEVKRGPGRPKTIRS